MSNELQRLILEFPDKPWDWDGLSRNPNITMKFVNSNPDKPWGWEWLSLNRFKLHPQYRGLPDVSPQKKRLHRSLMREAWCIPPNVSSLPVFKRGGVLCLEDAREAMSLL